MELSSARNLKLELRTAFGPSDVRGDTGIALGIAPGANSGQYRVAVRVRSAASLPADVMAGITRMAAGEVDFRITGRIVARPATELRRSGTFAIGASIAHYESAAGTVGFFARRISDGSLGIVSNNHVLAAEDRGKEGDAILHPGPADGGRRPVDVVAHLAGDYPRLKQKGQRVDCAFARIVRGIPHDPLGIAPGIRLSPVAAPVDGARNVEKVGRTTGMTRGRVTAFDLDDADVEYSFGVVRLSGSIEIESATAAPFSRGGDSGSLVFNAERQPIGLVYACSVLGGPYDNGLTYANPIDDVLSALRVTFAS